MALKHWAFNRENPVSNTLGVVSKLGQFRSLHVASVHSAINECLAIDSGGYLNE